MKVIGRYSRFCDSVDVVPENSLMVLEVSAATVDTYDRSPLCDDSRCSIRLTVEGSKFGFKVGYASFDKNLPTALAEEIIEILYTNGTLDLRKYDGVTVYGGHEKGMKVYSEDDYLC
ncbi:MAG: hypothetical protein IKU61_03045 [Clostridia bacterium]|nr:hypothetical protein [Clostridia bacterium]